MKYTNKPRSEAYRAVFLAALMVLATAVMGVGSVAATAHGGTPIVDASAGVTTYTVGGTGAVVDPAIVVSDGSGGDFDGARVVIQDLQVGDQLASTDQHGIAGSYDASSGVLTLSGTATAAEYQDVFRSVTFSNTGASPDTSDRRVTFSIGSTLPNDDNGHFYEYVSADGISWHDANAAANAKSYLGLQGYLVTVTSEAENDFVAEKLQGNGWLGASDDTAFSYISKDNGNDRWYWVTGPEAGTHFWTGGADESVNAPAPGQYANWAPGEPNDYFKNRGPDNENYAHFYFGSGTWNDYPDTWGVDGYVVEYGGMAGDPAVTWQDTKTVAVTVPPANVAPTITVDDDAVSVDEGGTATNGGAVGDADDDPVTLSASVGTVVDGGDGTWSWSFDATDGPTDSQTVTVTAEDDDAASTSVSFDLVVANVAPVLSADVDDTGVAGSPVTASGSFTDAGVADTHAVTIDWGDGSSSSAAVTQGAGSGSFTGSHAYASGGAYDVTVTVEDDDGGVDTYTASIAVAHLATIDVKPDSAENPVNPKAKGVLPVAILNTGDLDLTQVDVSTLRLSATEGGAGAAPAHGGHLEDVDDDGDLDLLVHFVNADIGLTGDTTAVYLSGSMADGVPVVGEDSVRPVGDGRGNAANGNGRGR